MPAHVCQLDQIPSFCFATSDWEIHKCLPSEQHGFPGRRRCHGCVLLGDKIYITGGTNGVDIYDDIWSLDLRMYQWEKLPFVSKKLQMFSKSLSLDFSGIWCKCANFSDTHSHSINSIFYSTYIIPLGEQPENLEKNPLKNENTFLP